MYQSYWTRTFKDIGALWKHDGHPKRPYALLSTPAVDGRRRITNCYFNSAVVQEHATVFGEACEALVSLGAPYIFSGPNAKMYAIGAAEGGIALSMRIAEALHIRSAYAVKVGDAFAFERFAFIAPTALLLVEDTITTGATLLKLQTAAHEACEGGCIFAPQILGLCERLGAYKLLTDRRVITLVHQEVQEWAEGENPFTRTGHELVEPVKAKTHWQELTRAYE